MPVRRIGWQGATRSRHLRAQMELGLTRWQQGWFLEPPLAATIRAVGEIDDPAQFGYLWWKLERDNAVVHFGADADISLLLGAEVLRMEATEDCALIREVGAACFDDLCCSLWGGAQASDLSPSPCPIFCDAESRFGSVIFEVDGLAAPVRIIAARSWCDRFDDQPARRSGSLVGRHAALNSTGVTVSAHIELGTILLADSLGWSVGEVLVTEATRHSPVALKVGGRSIRAAKLVDGQGVRAVAML
jgi:hypothetical protein